MNKHSQMNNMFPPKTDRVRKVNEIVALKMHAVNMLDETLFSREEIVTMLRKILLRHTASIKPMFYKMYEIGFYERIALNDHKNFFNFMQFIFNNVDFTNATV